MLNFKNRLNLFANPQRYKAFTLAEVLITLGIIGIVAAMTIPSLVKNTQEKELKSAWKELYSQINQATSTIMNENGGTLVGVCDDDSSTNANYLKDNSDCFAKAIADKFKTVTDIYKYNDTTHSFNLSYKFLNGNPDTGNISTLSRVQLNNGAILYIYRFGNSNGCISVDVNGQRGPNVHGKDLFRIWISPNALHPAGWSGDWSTPASSCSTNSSVTSSGDGCAAIYLYNENFQPSS